MKIFLQQAARALPVLLRDMIGVAGVLSVAYGFHEIYAPLGFIVGGGLAVAGAFLSSRAG